MMMMMMMINLFEDNLGFLWLLNSQPVVPNILVDARPAIIIAIMTMVSLMMIMTLVTPLMIITMVKLIKPVEKIPV